MKERAKLLVRNLAALLFFGLTYAWMAIHWGVYIPCVFRMITGLKCPGCGISHMCLDLLRFRFRSAFFDHPVLFVLLPVMGVIALKKFYEYVKTGNKRLSSIENKIMVASIVILILFGIIRNIIELL